MNGAAYEEVRLLLEANKYPPQVIGAFRAEVRAERDAEIIAWLGKKAREYGDSNRENRAKAEAVGRMADKLSRGAVRPNNSAMLPPTPTASGCVCRTDLAEGPAHEGHAKWCPASRPTVERIAEIRQGIGDELTRDELHWLSGAAGRNEAHIIGARGGHWPLTDDLPGVVVVLAQYLAASVAVIERSQPYASTSPSWEKDTREGESTPQPAEVTIYRASHDSIVMGLYTSREAARAHCETLTRREIGDAGTLGWVPDDGSEDASEELSVFGPEADEDGVPDETCTGYVVTPLTVASAYDEEADE